MASRHGCTYPYCDRAREKDRDTTMCEAHGAEWLRSAAFREACRNEDVRAAMGLGLKTMAMRLVAKFRRKWAKAHAGVA